MTDLAPRTDGTAPTEATTVATAWGSAVGIALVALLADLGLRGGPANAVTAGALVVVVGLLLVGRRVSRMVPRLLLVGSLPFAVFLAVRASPWLVVSNLAAYSALVGAAVCFSRSGSLFDTGLRALVARGAHSLGQGVLGVLAVARAVPRGASPVVAWFAPVGRALLVALPFLVALVVLLASADAVFAGLITPDLGVPPLLGHGLVLVLAAAVALVIVLAAGADRSDPPAGGRFGVAEVATMLGLAVAVLALFVLSQVVATTAAGERLVAASGMTPAQYARSGFFQLCWATALVVVFLAVVRALAGPGVFATRSVRALAGAVPVLALGLVGVSLRRMALYDDAFGMTMLRLWVVAAACWMGVALIMLALRGAGLGRDRSWVFGGAVVAGLVLVLVLDVADPEGFVVRHNAARARAGAPLDAGYLAELSDDAVPALAAEAEVETDPARRLALEQAISCGDEPGGAAAWNLAARRGSEVRAEVCR